MAQRLRQTEGAASLTGLPHRPRFHSGPESAMIEVKIGKSALAVRRGSAPLEKKREGEE